MIKRKKKGFLNLKELIIFAKQNYFITIIAVCVLFVGVVSVYKLFFAKPTFIYVKVHMGQGLWWANTQRPAGWFVDAIKQARVETDLTGRPIVEVQNVTYYPWYGSSQYDTYINVVLKVSRLGKTGKYNFKRSTIGVGAPVDFEFDNVQFSGTIVALSEEPINNTYVTKTVTLTKKGAYPWEYDAIPIGDTYNNGQTETLKVMEKNNQETASIYSDMYGNNLPLAEESKRYITVKLRLKGKVVDGQFLYGEEQLVSLGRSFTTSSSHFTFNDYMVAGIE
jgi:hypothetical protein